MPPAKAQIPSVRPISRLRCLKLNISLMHTCTNRMNPPPAAPWNARPTIKARIVSAAADAAELAKNSASVTRIMSFRPHISESLAQIGPATAFMMRYAAPTHV
jgi:hypothetical protein